MKRWPVPSVAAVVIDDGRVLLIQRGREPSKGKWSLPGGRLEMGEMLEAAVKREAREETGLEIETDGIAGVYDLIVRDGDEISFHYVIIDYYAHQVSGGLRAGDDAADVRWVPFADLPTLDLAEHLRERLDEMLRMHDGNMG